MLDQQKTPAGKADLKFETETRSCTNDGCKRTFRVLVTSTQTVCGATCPYATKAQMKEYNAKLAFAPQRSQAAHDEHRIKMREKLQASAQNPAKKAAPVEDNFVAALDKPKPKIVIDLEPPEPEATLTAEQEIELKVKRWDSYVQRAKSIVRRVNRDRMKIAQLAIEACDIRHGGGDHWKHHEGVYTLQRFADDIGVHYKTLHNWVVVKRDIKDILPPEEWDEENWGAALRTRNKVNKKTPRKRVIEVYRKERSRKGPGITFHTMVKRLSDARHYLLHRMDLTEIDQEDLDKMEGYLQRYSFGDQVPRCRRFGWPQRNQKKRKRK